MIWSQNVRIFLFLLVATSGSLVQVQGDNEDGLKPYLDADGNLCQDKMETVQDTEYETMIQCRVAMKKSCSQQRMTEDDNEVGGHDNHEESSPDNACHTVYEKNCQTVYRPHRNKVRVRICPDGKINVANSPFQVPPSLQNSEENENSIVLDVRPDPRLPPVSNAKCRNGRRTVCTTKYHTECTTQQVQQTMQEDYPKCQLEMVENCSEDEKSEKSKCQRVPAMRCKIEKRTVVKTQPESKCSRVPRQYCRKEECSNEDDLDKTLLPPLNKNDPNCYYRNQIVNEIVPEEKCSLRPKQMCHSVTEEPQFRQRARRSAQPAPESPLAFLRRHYLSRRNQQKIGQMLPRRSRNFLESSSTTTTTTEKPQMRQICKMVPEQECEKKRVNPRVVEKQMMKKFCRQPRKSSYVDQLLVARLKGGLK